MKLNYLVLFAVFRLLCSSLAIFFLGTGDGVREREEKSESDLE